MSRVALLLSGCRKLLTHGVEFDVRHRGVEGNLFPGIIQTIHGSVESQMRRVDVTLLRNAENQRLNACSPDRRWRTREAGFGKYREPGAERERRDKDILALRQHRLRLAYFRLGEAHL